MKHLGSITEINGAEVVPVDIICGGSPCQDLSVAGKQAGIHNGERSHLFFEMTRIIREMRGASNGKYPRYVVWENVPGAFSSNQGRDFLAVLQAFAGIADPDVHVPEPERRKDRLAWKYAGEMVGDGWSIAWRTVDAQYWGVPQRRRRIYLVADLGSERVGEILFKRTGLSGDSEPGGTARKGTARHAEGSIEADDRAGENAGNDSGIGLDAVALEPGAAQRMGGHAYEGVSGTLRANAGDNQMAVSYTLKIRSGCEGSGKGALIQEDKSATLLANNDQYLFQPTAYSFDSLTSNSMKSSNPHSGCREVDVAKTLDTTDPNPSKNQGGIAIVEQYLFENHSQDTRYKGSLDVCPMLPAQLGTGGNNTPFVVEDRPVYCLQGNGIDRADTAGCNGKGWKEDSSYTLNTIDRPAVAYATDVGFFYSQEDASPTLLARMYKNPHLVTYPASAIAYIVRRLTPTECARLQGFPYRWGDIDQKDSFTPEEYRFWLEVRNTHAAINGKQVKEYTAAQMLIWYNKLHTDSAEYGMWGNGMALPNMLHVMRGIAKQHEKELMR